MNCNNIAVNPVPAGCAIYRGYETQKTAASCPFFMDIAKAKQAYRTQKRGARHRGIEWQLTFEQWQEWWGEDLPKRGRGRNDLSMQRPCDSGPYALGNIRKGTPKDNARTRAAMQPKPCIPVMPKGPGRVRELDDGSPDLGYVTLWSVYG